MCFIMIRWSLLITKEQSGLSLFASLVYIHIPGRGRKTNFYSETIVNVQTTTFTSVNVHETAYYKRCFTNRLGNSGC